MEKTEGKSKFAGLGAWFGCVKDETKWKYQEEADGHASSQSGVQGRNLCWRIVFKAINFKFM